VKERSSSGSKPASGPDLDQGTRALNREFSRFEQVEKRQEYYLSEQPDKERFDDDYVIESCDLSGYLAGSAPERRAFADRLGGALKDIGFAILTGHGIDPALYEQAEALTLRLFEETSPEQRMAYRAKRHGSVNQGYFPVRETTIIHPDLVEGWVFCRRAFALDHPERFRQEDFWPEPGFEPDFRRLVKAQEQLILPLMQSLLLYLGCDPNAYDQKLTGCNFGFRLNYYPPVDPGQVPSGGRMLGHEDVDLFTFLPAPRVDGLQVLNRRNMKWIRLDAPPGSIILNTGDYMQRISNDIFPSTTHRVAQPRDPESMAKPRVSFPMAIYTWEDEILEVLPGLGKPKYPPIRSEDFHTAITSKYYGEGYATAITTD
jgi:isopenicillin N synthase-like dioxygenase